MPRTTNRKHSPTFGLHGFLLLPTLEIALQDQPPAVKKRNDMQQYNKEIKLSLNTNRETTIAPPKIHRPQFETSFSLTANPIGDDKCNKSAPDTVWERQPPLRLTGTKRQLPLGAQRKTGHPRKRKRMRQQLVTEDDPRQYDATPGHGKKHHPPINGHH